MNNERRQKIHDVLAIINYSMSEEKIQLVKEKINDILMDEQIAYDNMPEGLQQSERGEISEQSIEAMETAIDNLDAILKNDLGDKTEDEMVDEVLEGLEDIFYL